MPIQQLLRERGVGAFTGGITDPNVPDMNPAGSDDIRQTNCGKCAWVDKAQDMNVTILQILPTNAVAYGAYTKEGHTALLEHEGRRRLAWQRAYDAYIAPAFGGGALPTKCGLVCNSTPGVAKTLVEMYLKCTKKRAVKQFLRWGLAEQRAIGGERAVFADSPDKSTQWYRDYGAPPVIGFDNIHQVSVAPPFKPCPCPPGSTP
jgi:hypothetical protein